jgi:hypothetical protein
MSDAWKARVATFWADPIIKNQMASVNVCLDAIAKQRYDTVSWNQ